MTTVNYLEKITELYAFVSVAEGGEGVVGQLMNMLTGQTFMPFVCADYERMESLKPMAQEIAKPSGKKIKLIKLTNREEIESYDGTEN